MKIGLKIVLVYAIIIMHICGCQNNEKNFDVEYYGSEVYNASYIYVSGETVRHIIPVMSKKDISEVMDIELESEGGVFELEYLIEDGAYDYEGYHLYKLVLDFSNIEFEMDDINIKKIDLYFENDEKMEMLLDKCQIVTNSLTYNVDYVDINGSPLRIPSDMTKIPLELSSTENVIIKNIYLTNDSMKLGNYNDGEGNVSEVFTDIMLLDDGQIRYWSADFGIENSELSLYKHYGTSIIIVYEHNGNTYYTIPGVSRTIYNPFDAGYDGIQRYFDKLRGSEI